MIEFRLYYESYMDNFGEDGIPDESEMVAIGEEILNT